MFKITTLTDFVESFKEKISEMNYFIEKAYQGKGTLKNIFPNLEEWSREALTKKLIQVFEGI